LIVANIINLAADLGGMVEATRMVTVAPAALIVPRPDDVRENRV